MAFNPSKPYNDLPLLPPRAEIETKAILRKAVSARAALAELKGIAETIPQPEILINTIVSGQLKPASNGHFLEPKTRHSELPP
jgi:Fic/DOC family N-terminal